MSKTSGRGWLVLGLAGTLALAACGSDDSSTADASSAASSSAGSTHGLDAIGVIGHSGATGWNSDDREHDVTSNSWITGTNPAVDSIYLRLLAEHPALEDHNWNEAVSGSSVTTLMDQAEALLGYDPVPDIVFIVSIDNDIQCDGSDEKNYDRFESSMTDVVTFLRGRAPGIKVFFNDQAVDVRRYDELLMARHGGLEHLKLPGPCNVIKDGGLDPAGEQYLQEQVDTYFKRLVHICAQVTDCATDEGQLQQMGLTDEDVSLDMNHFTVSGLAKEAAIVWEQLPPEWK